MLDGMGEPPLMIAARAGAVFAVLGVLGFLTLRALDIGLEIVKEMSSPEMLALERAHRQRMDAERVERRSRRADKGER